MCVCGIDELALFYILFVSTCSIFCTVFLYSKYIYGCLCYSFLARTKICSVIDFYPRDAMLARVFATATCLSVCHMPVLCLAERKEDREMYTV